MLGLDIISPAFLAGLVLVSLLAWAGARRAHRRRQAARRAGSAWVAGRRRTVVAAVLAAVLSLLAVADGVNHYFGYLPRAGDLVAASWPTVPATQVLPPQDPPPGSGSRLSRALAHPSTHPHGAVVAVPVADRASHFGRHDAQAYLPPQYFTDPSRRFPVLYLLHGSPGVPEDWLRGGEAAVAGEQSARAGHPVIIVVPRASHGWLDDSECVDSRTEKVDTYVTSDVVAAVDAGLRTQADRAHRGIAGMSAGGFCALNLGLRHHDEFSVILDMSGLTRPTHEGGDAALFGPGAAGATAARANTPADYLPGLHGPLPAVWLDCGTGDKEVRPGLTVLRGQLESAGAAVTMHVRPGSHTFHVWVPALRESLSWAGTLFGASPDAGASA